MLAPPFMGVGGLLYDNIQAIKPNQNITNQNKKSGILNMW